MLQARMNFVSAIQKTKQKVVSVLRKVLYHISNVIGKLEKTIVSSEGSLQQINET